MTGKPKTSGDLLKNRIADIFSDAPPETFVSTGAQKSPTLPNLLHQPAASGFVEAPLPDHSDIENIKISTLPMQSFRLDINAEAILADKAFQNSPELVGVIIHDQSLVCGIISRRKYYETLGKPFGVAIFLHRPIRVMLVLHQTETLSVPSDSLITETVNVALNRSPDQIYDPILVVRENGDHQLLDIDTLLLAQMRLFTSLSQRVQNINQQLEQRVRSRTAELQQEVTVRRRAELMLEIRLRYEKTLNLCANVLLTGADHDDTIQQTLLHLIQAVGVSRVFYLERVKTENVGLGLEMRYQVSADHIAAFPEHRSLFSDSIWGNWFAILWQGKPIIGQRETADPKAKELLREVGLVSVLLIPVGELDNWVGAIGFGETENKRVWDENEIQLLFTIAQMLFAYIERRRNALALGQARDEALRASQFKSELLAKISHELRTPLGAVLGYAQLLYFGSYGEMSAEQKGAAEVVISSTKYLNTLVNGILDQAQLESGQLVLTNRPFDLRQMAAEVETRIRVLAQSKGLVFEVNIGPGIPEWMMGDKMRLEQVLINLLGNAVKFTDSGKISMHFHIMGDNRLAIEVSDTGSGIPLDAQEQIFAPFVQVDGSPTRRHSGTGLGLSISKQLVTMMNGQIKLISEPGQGSTFTVELPIRAYVESVDEIGKDEKHHNH